MILYRIMNCYSNLDLFGLVTVTMAKTFCGRGVYLFREMIFTHHLARINCVILLLCGDILPNPGPPRYLCGVCNRSV